MSHLSGHAVVPSGKRNHKRRTAFATAGALLAAAAAAVVPFESAAAAPKDDACVLQELPMPDDKYFSIVTGMSTDSEFIVYRAYPAQISGDERYPYLYANGEAIEVPMPGIEQILSDVNGNGLAVGSAYVDGVELPYAYHDGLVAELAANEGGAAKGVNDHGDIVGVDGLGNPVVWRLGQTKPEVLPLPEGAVTGQAASIGEDGTIVGSYEDPATGGTRAYVWHPDGTGEALPLPADVDPADLYANYASDISGDWAAGYIATPELEAGVRWNLDDGTVEILDMVYAPAVSDDGTSVGEATPHAAYQEAGGKTVALPGVTDPADNWFGDTATEISADGELLAGQVYAGQDEADWHILKAVTWTCD